MINQVYFGDVNTIVQNDYMEGRTVIEGTNCIWKAKPLVECSKSLACTEIIKSGHRRDMTIEKVKVICKKHKVKYKSIVKLLGWDELNANYKINKR